jgi:hypothetical protein
MEVEVYEPINLANERNEGKNGMICESEGLLRTYIHIKYDQNDIAIRRGI